MYFSTSHHINTWTYCRNIIIGTFSCGIIQSICNNSRIPVHLPIALRFKMALFACISSRSRKVQQTSPPDSSCFVRAFSCSDKSSKVPETLVPTITGHNRESLEKNFHTACVQLVSLNFALHEATTGAVICTTPKSSREHTRKYRPNTLRELRDMYYKSVLGGADRLDLLSTGFEEFTPRDSRRNSISESTAAASPAYELSQNYCNKSKQQGHELDSFDTLNFFPTSLRATVPLSIDATQYMIKEVPKQISLSQFANTKYDPDDSAFEGCSSVNSTSTTSGCYDVTSSDVWVKRSLSFEEEDDSIDSGFDPRTSTRTLYLKSTYV